MMKLVTIYGGSGFLGRHIARRMAQAGWRVRVAVRRPAEAGFVRTYGSVGQVEPVLCNIRDDDSVALAMAGADAVVNTVGILAERGRNSFEAVQHDGPDRIARLAAAAGIARVVHVSAIGADADGDSDYARTKALGEAAVLAHVPGAVILRPSIMFGAGDSFFNRFAGMTRFGPILPIVGGDTLFQPVHVDDVAQAAQKALLGQVAAGTYELGGPDTESLRALMQRMLGVIRRRRLILNIPFWAARIKAAVFEFFGKISLGLAPVPFTRDQVEDLRHDNVVAEGANSLSDLGILPVSMDAVLEDYLWRFRPSGQYAEITESAKNLRIGNS